MATERGPIKVPCENEDSPGKENATDFDEDTLAGDLGSSLASLFSGFLLILGFLSKLSCFLRLVCFKIGNTLYS